MKCTLMHVNLPVAGLTLDDDTCTILSVNDLYLPQHIPVGVRVLHNQIDRKGLNDWWLGRAIPASRVGIAAALDKLNIRSAQSLIDKCYGLSLSDQYWIKPESENVSWCDINFFDNAFSSDVGNILFGGDLGENRIDLFSPDNTSDGWLKKKWVRIGGTPSLIKGGSGATQQEPYNEVLASAIMRRLNIPHIPYELTMIEQYPYSVCEDFIKRDTELVSAWYVMQTQKMPNHVSVYNHFVNCCSELGIKDVEQSVAMMIALDFIIVNEDRHQNNFGLIRNADTLKWIGFAPIFDSGTSMWFDRPISMISPASENLRSKPFKTTHAEQIKLVSDFNWLDMNALKGIDEEFSEILQGSAFIDDARRDRLCFALNKRIQMLDKMRTCGYASGTTENDVRDDVAYAGETEEDNEI